jgi:hypothetical protein
MSREALLRWLPADGTAGASQYRQPGALPAPGWPADEDAELVAAAAEASETGCVLFERADEMVLVVPPFAAEGAGDYPEIRLAPLKDLLERPRAVAVFLLRLGGFSIGFFRGEQLIDSKTDQRFVKNRHRKGGQSQRRFDRIREKQVHELFEKACEEAQATLGAYEREIAHVFFGGDRRTLQAFRKECAYFERFGERVLRRVLPVAGDPRRATLDVMPREIWSSEVYVVRRDRDMAAQGG